MPDYTPTEGVWLRVFDGIAFQKPDREGGLLSELALPDGRLRTHHTPPVYEPHPTKYSQTNRSDVEREQLNGSNQSPGRVKAVLRQRQYRNCDQRRAPRARRRAQPEEYTGPDHAQRQGRAGRR